MSKRIANRTLYAAVVAALYSSAGSAQQAPATTSTELDTVVVTGSLIRGTPEDAALPVEVFTSEQLMLSGDPSPLEFVKSLTISGPTTGEAYYFSGSALTNNVQFNLRGIGADKTLTLFNGRRAFQNVTVYPSGAIERIEVLKDGAAVTYGADATGGVVNMITKNKFQGIELSSSYKHYKGSEQGEWKLGGLAGFSTDFADVIFAVEWDHRSELDTSEREFSSLPYGVNPAPSSTLTNLASWLPRLTPPPPGRPTIVQPISPLIPQNGQGEWGTPAAGNGSAAPGTGYISDFTRSSCNAVGGIFVAGGIGTNSCAYNYIPYYNLVEENDVYRVYAQLRSTISDSVDFHLRALWTRNYSPHQYGSPSQPVVRGPALTTGATHQLYVPATNPYTAHLRANSGYAGPAEGFTPLTYRVFAHGGNSAFASGNNHSTPNENETKYWHVTSGFAGDVTDTVGFDVWATFNQFVATNSQPDILGYRLQNALNGFDDTKFGIQNPGAAGTNGCQWYNPFASNFAAQPTLGLANPNYVPGAENPQELVRWLYNERVFEDTSWNFTVDAVLSGTLPLSLPGGEIGWGAGAQWRTAKNRQSVPDPLYNGQTPCDWPGQNPAATTDPLFTGCTLDQAGPYLFFANNPPDATEQKQQSYFAEFNFPIFDSWSVSAAGRYEKFMPIGLDATVYKISSKWQIVDQFALRGSYGTNYQAPGPDIIPGNLANGVLSYTRAGGAWLGATTFTQSDIKPETATVWNLGAIAQFEFGSDQDLQIILDYFNIETEDELGLVASTNDIANSIFSSTSPGLANCSHPLIDRVTFNGGSCIQGTSAATGANGFASIRTDFGNGPGQTTTGFDLQLNYGLSLGAGRLGFVATVTKVETNETTATILDGYLVKAPDDRVGYLNFATVAQAVPEWRGNFSVNYALGEHNVRAALNYVSGVKDERYIKDDNTINIPAITPAGSPVGGGVGTTFGPSYYGVIGDKWLSADLHYLWRAEWATVGLSVLNVTDQDPPESRQEFGYDPRIGNPLGRQFEVSLRKKF
jgi:iron complex outermembrane receptor protein